MPCKFKKQMTFQVANDSEIIKNSMTARTMTNRTSQCNKVSFGNSTVERLEQFRKKQEWQNELLDHIDERKTNYDTVICRFGKYLSNFKTYCSEDKEEIQA